MNRYYCPFCSSRYQFHITRSDGVLICGHCGDALIKKPLINSRQILGLVTASAFFVPLIVMIFLVINDFSKDKIPNNSETLVFLLLNK